MVMVKKKLNKIKSKTLKAKKKAMTEDAYANSHWIIFFLQGLIELIFGAVVLFGGASDRKTLVTIVALVLLATSVTEFFNIVHRRIFRKSTGFIFAIIFVQVVVARLLLVTVDYDFLFHLALIAGYSVMRGITDLLVAFRSLVDRTDRFIWIVCGIVGMVFGFAILNSGHLSFNNSYIQFFGAYMMVFGFGNLIYAINFSRRKLKKI